MARRQFWVRLITDITEIYLDLRWHIPIFTEILAYRDVPNYQLPTFCVSRCCYVRNCNKHVAVDSDHLLKTLVHNIGSNTYTVPVFINISAFKDCYKYSDPKNNCRLESSPITRSLCRPLQKIVTGPQAAQANYSQLIPPSSFIRVTSQRGVCMSTFRFNKKCYL